MKDTHGETTCNECHIKDTMNFQGHHRTTSYYQDKMIRIYWNWPNSNSPASIFLSCVIQSATWTTLDSQFAPLIGTSGSVFCWSSMFELNDLMAVPQKRGHISGITLPQTGPQDQKTVHSGNVHVIVLKQNLFLITLNGKCRLYWMKYSRSWPPFSSICSNTIARLGKIHPHFGHSIHLAFMGWTEVLLNESC